MSSLRPEGLSQEQVIDLTRRTSAHNYSPQEVVLARGEGIWVWDKNGNRYIDMLGCYSALNIGHLHPQVVDAAIRQLGKISLTSRAFYTEEMARFCETLAGLTGLGKILPMNSGAEAVETAIKLCRRWAYNVKGVEAERAEIIVCQGNFHGRTTTIISFSDDPVAHDGYGPYTPGFVTIPYGDAQAFERAITPRTAAFLVEPIQGEGGIIIPGDGFLREARRICDHHRLLLALDEVQTGFCRTGRMFAFQHEGIAPDVLILGKALGGGLLPVSAVAAPAEVMDAVFTPGSHGSTFGGNPLSCAVALAAMELMVEERMDEQAAEKGRWFLEALRALGSPLVREVRGRGLLVGMEFHLQAGKAKKYFPRFLAEGILTKETHDQTLRFAPPLIITRDELELAVEKIGRALRA